MTQYLILSLALFFIGAWGVMARRNLLIMLMSVELMLNGVNIALVGFARARAPAEPLGHVFTLMVMGVAAAEVAVGLAILIALFRNRQTVDSEAWRQMKG